MCGVTGNYFDAGCRPVPGVLPPTRTVFVPTGGEHGASGASAGRNYLGASSKPDRIETGGGDVAKTSSYFRVGGGNILKPLLAMMLRAAARTELSLPRNRNRDITAEIEISLP